jgi:hypothetical protein
MLIHATQLSFLVHCPWFCWMIQITLHYQTRPDASKDKNAKSIIFLPPDQYGDTERTSVPVKPTQCLNTLLVWIFQTV